MGESLRGHYDDMYKWSNYGTFRIDKFGNNIMTERCNCDASCGENRYHDRGSRGCKYEYTTEEDTTPMHLSQNRVVYGRPLTIPTLPIGTNPSQYSMSLTVDKAININEEYQKLEIENTRMRKALQKIIKYSDDGEMIRIALEGLDLAKVVKL